METHPLEGVEELEDDYACEVPEDVAVLYSWANLEGGRYRDFSAHRRERRAQMRERAAERMRLAQLQAQAEAEEIAKQAEIDAAAMEALARLARERVSGQGSRKTDLGGHAWADPKLPEEQEDANPGSFRAASQEARRAAAERESAAPRAEAAALAESLARQTEEEAVEARASAVRQSVRYAEAGLRGWTATGLEADAYILEEVARPHSLQDDDSADPVGTVEDNPAVKGAGEFEAGAKAEAPETVVAGKLEETTVDMESVPASKCPAAAEREAEVVLRIPGAESAGAPAGSRVPTGPLTGPLTGPVSLFEIATHAMSELFEAQPVGHEANARETRNWDDGSPLSGNEVPADEQRIPANEEESRTASFRPGADELPGREWLHPRRDASAIAVPPAASVSSPDVPELLDHSRKRIAARWFALRRLFARDDADPSSEDPEPVAEIKQAPIVAVFSIAGGAGKTSLVATLGRALSFLGERVLLSETAAYGLLPFYFGSGHRASGTVRVFTPPPGSTDAPIRLVSYSDEAEGHVSISEDLVENSQRANRVLIDLSADRLTVVAGLAQFKPTILVPLLLDINSVISIDAIEKLFGAMLDAAGKPLQPIYLLNQFDASLPLHLDIREVLKQQLCERLLPIAIRRSPAVGEALAEGMTIVDYDPGSAAAEDYMRLAKWLCGVSAPASVGVRNQRWSER